MSIAHPHKNKQKKAKPRKSKRLRTYNPPIIRDDIPDRPPKTKPMGAAERRRLISAIVAEKTGLNQMFDAIHNY